MPSKNPFRQLELEFAQRERTVPSVVLFPDAGDQNVVEQALGLPNLQTATGAVALQFCSGRDPALEQQARYLLRANGVGRIASQIRVEWNTRLKTCAGRADYKAKLISLNPLLQSHGSDEIDRTFRHELAHLLAQFRAGRKRILPHGEQWRKACQDLGIGNEKRCHNLPFPIMERAARFLYRCPNCRRYFPRVRKIRRAMACLACCRKHNGGEFDTRFKLRMVQSSASVALASV
jgi:SprT protein